MNVDIALHCGFVCTMDPKRPKVEKDLVIGITANKIVMVAKENETQGLVAKKTFKLPNSWVIPGLINAHTHLPMTLFRGLGDDQPLKDWLEKSIFPAEAREVNAEFVRRGTELALTEAINCGTTTLVDMYYFENDIAEVCDKRGVRAYLGQSVIDFPTPDNKNKDGSDYKILNAMVDRYKKHDRIQPMIAPHAPYTCSDETLKTVVEYAQKNAILTSIHVSETLWEQDDSITRFKMSPMERMKKLGILSTPSLLAHCVHLSDSDISLMKGSQAAAVYNPESNMKLGSGISPVVKMRAQGVCVALGTDGCASNNDLNMIGEMRSGAFLQKVGSGNNAAIGAYDLLDMATVQGAKALHAWDRIGSLEVGKEADITAIGLEHPHLQPLNEIPSLIYALQGFEVSHVFCAGKQLK